MTRKRINKPLYLSLLSCLVLAGCASQQATKDYQLNSSYLQGEVIVQPNGQPTTAQPSGPDATAGFIRVPSLASPAQGFNSDAAIADRFSKNETLTIATDTMPLIDYLHYSFGELLQANYILGEGLAALAPVTLNIQQKISPQKLYSLTEQLLLERGVGIKRQNDLLYISALPKTGNDITAVGYGRTADTVPNALNVRQIVPLRYIVNTNALETLRIIANVQTGFDSAQGLLILTGEHQQVVRALELLELLDSPGSHSRNVGFLKLTYLTAEQFIKSITELLANEGIMSPAGGRDNRVSFVPLVQLGAVAVFASEAEFLNRIQYWAKQIDKPSAGSEQQYFIYAPRYARASDLGQSVSALISGGSATQRNTAQNSSEQRAAQIENRAAQTTTSAENENMRMVVDERSNTLIFYASGTDYQAMLPLVERLDVMPKQVMLELTIAEVTLTDEFKLGVDAAFSSGKFALTNSFGAAAIGGTVLKWASGVNSINAQAFETNRLVNVLSKPTLLVRDGVSANINVGTDIPIVGKTTTDPTNGTTRSVEYRFAGIDVSVTPTINAQGVVIMSIEQSNSNQVDGGASLEGNPQIFERSIKTEVVAESGQTIVLGGLISENRSNNQDGLPALHRLPILGALFGTKSRNNTKTELVIMVTPRVIQRSDEWDDIKRKLNSGMEFIGLN
ncbi:secretin N-terminal domain-containing protein [Rheinheimera metallidurans]|uniref:secretin N-terminal domain-containing protein n=1 Tax=Rheinheimera metallidurans TaxID=2925781 RepID=UPI0030021633